MVVVAVGSGGGSGAVKFQRLDGRDSVLAWLVGTAGWSVVGWYLMWE